MRTLPALALLLAIGTATAPGQTFVRASAGATYSTDLVGEVIQDPISTRQGIAPTGTLLVGWTLPSGYRLGVEARYAAGTLEVDDGGVGEDLGSLATLQVGILGDGPIRGAFRWEAVVGMLRYSPEHDIGVFRDDSPSPLILGGGISWSRPLAAALDLLVGARYDFHSFSSQRLEGDGYSSSQAVHRFALTLGVERRF
jgi:hypothetical protein